MNLKLRSLFLAGASLTALGNTVASADIMLYADLTNAQEITLTVPTLSNGSPRPASYGSAIFTLNEAMTALSFTGTIHNIDFTGSQTADINDNLVAAHIHASATVTPATTGAVVFGFIGTPFNDTAPNDTIVTPFINGVGGSFSSKWDLSEGNNTTLTAQLSNLMEGRAYINFHTSQFGAGEVRGAIVSRVPDGGTTSVLLVFAGAILLSLRRKLSWSK